MIRLPKPCPWALATRSVLAGSLLLALALVPAVGQEIAPPGFVDDEMAALLERYEESAAPGAEHARLASFVGEWATTTRVWLGGPGGSAALSEGRSEVRGVLGGRFLLETTQGEVAGQPTEGLGLIGFDRAAGRYESVWVDSGNTGMYRSQGSWSEERGALVLSGQREDPVTGEVGRFEYVRRIVDVDHWVFEIHDLSLGGMVVEVDYLRDGP